MRRRPRASRRPGGARDRRPPGGGLPALRVRLPQLRPGVAAAAAVAPARPGGHRHPLRPARTAAARPRLHGAAAARPVDQRHRHVPRPRLLPGLPPDGRAHAAHLSLPAHLERGLLHRRGDLLPGHHAGRGGPARPHPDLRHRHQPVGAGPGPRRRLPAGEDAGVHRELPGRGGHEGVLRVLRGRLRRRPLRPRPGGERGLRPAQPGGRPLVQRVPRARVPQRAHLLRQDAAGPGPPPVLRQPGPFRDPRPGPEGVRGLHAPRARLPGARRAPADLPQGRPPAGARQAADR